MKKRLWFSNNYYYTTIYDKHSLHNLQHSTTTLHSLQHSTLAYKAHYWMEKDFWFPITTTTQRSTTNTAYTAYNTAYTT